MTARSPERRARDRAAAVALVEAAMDDAKVYAGVSTFALRSWYKQVSELRRFGERGYRDRSTEPWARMHWEHLSEDLSWAADHGLVGRIPGRWTNRASYASLAYHNAVLEEEGAFAEALENYEAAQARAAEVHAGLAGELAALGYPGDAARLSTASLRWLLDRLPVPADA